MCAVCKDDHAVNDQPVNVNFDNESLEFVDKFCYLGDTISVGGGAEAATIARTRCGWGKFRELRPLLTMRSLPLHLKGKVYTTCVRRAMIYGSETWPVKSEDTDRMERNEMKRVRWMCGVRLQDRVSNAELRRRLGIKGIKEEMRIG